VFLVFAEPRIIAAPTRRGFFHFSFGKNRDPLIGDDYVVLLYTRRRVAHARVPSLVTGYSTVPLVP